MRNKVLVLGLVFSLLVCSGNLIAKEKRGAELVILLVNGQKIRGELIAIKPTSLLLLDSQSGADTTIPIEDAKSIRIVKKPKILSGIAVSLLFGIGIGALVIPWNEPGGDTQWIKILTTGGIVIGIATGVGVIAGLVAGRDEGIQIQGKSDAEINKIMEKLRRRARVTNAL